MIPITSLTLALVLTFEMVQIGDVIPPFTLKTVEGRDFNSEKELSGKIGVVTFWRPDQVYSERLLRDLQELSTGELAKDMCVVAICSGENDAQKVAAVKERLGLSFAVALDPDRTVYGQFGVFVAPATGFIDKKGVLRLYYASHRRDFLEAARAQIELLLGQITEEEREARLKPGRAPAHTNEQRGMTQYKLGLQLLKRGNKAEAREHFRQAWEKGNGLVQAGVKLGIMLLEAGEDAEALSLFSDIVEVAPGHPEALGGQGVALIRTGNAAEGSELLRRALEQGPAIPLLYHEMGLWCEKSETHSDDALKYFRRGLEVALEIAPNP